MSLNHSRRLAELRSLAIMESPPEAEYDDLAVIAAAIFASPVAAVNFVDDTRHFTKAILGMPEALGESVSNEVSFCAATVASTEGVLVLADTHADESWRDHPLVIGEPQVGFYAGASIVSRGQRVGVVCAFGREPRAVSDEQRAALEALARQAAGQLELRRRYAELLDFTATDPLTGLANRTLLFDRLEAALADRSRSGVEVGVLFCDVDDFKGVNDRFGHEAGDRLLCDIGNRLRAQSRKRDTVARIAGDEFVLVCSVDCPAELNALVDRIEEAFQLPSTFTGGRLRPRLSVGAVLARDGEKAADVLRRADAAMYAAKGMKQAIGGRSLISSPA